MAHPRPLLSEIRSVLARQPSGRAVRLAELARELGVSTEEVRIGLWQLARLGLVRPLLSPETCGTSSTVCGGCPLAASCRPNHDAVRGALGWNVA